MITRRSVLAHEIDRRTIASFVVSWVLVYAVNGLTLPAIDPRPESIDRPLEQMTTVALLLPLAVSAYVVDNRLQWLAVVSPRSPALMDGLWFCCHFLVQLSALCVLLLAAPEVPRAHYLALHATLTALTLAGTAIAGPTWGVGLPIGLLVPFVLPGVLPWEHNLVFNLDRSQVSITVALLAAPILSLAAIVVKNRPH